jgi:transposase
MKTPSKLPDINRQTPLASGMALASTSVLICCYYCNNKRIYWPVNNKKTAVLTPKMNDLNRLKPNKYIQSLEAEIKQLKLTIAHHGRMRFGVKSEVFNEQQRDLFAEDWQVDDTDLQQHLEQLSTSPKAPRVRAGRQALAAHLPRIDIRHEPASCTCEQCGQALKFMRDEVVEKLDIIPIQFQVIRHIYPQMACRKCETIIAEPSELSVIDGGLATARLLAWVMVSKFVDHLPLYRLEQIALRQGVPFPRSTLADWVGRIGFSLQVLVDRLVAILRQRAVLHADETPVQQLDPKAKSGGTKKAYLWAYRSNALDGQDPIIVFDYQTSRAGHHARDFLQDWQGHLVVDDYAGYKALFEAKDKDGKPIRTEVGCWAHVRRKFFELHVANQSPMAAEALRRIGLLYEIEREAQEKGLSVPQRQALRLEKSMPVLLSLHGWLKEQVRTIAPNSGMAKALAHALKRWPSLVVYAQSGDIPMDNNPVENCIRPIALGKKNWLFAGSERAGCRAAAIQSLLATAKLNGLEPLTWLTTTLEKLPTWPNSRLDELLPLRSLTEQQE